ncbi:MAG: SipW-dependent-type signal peptide-containing protein [Halorubrum sp.]
MTDTQSPPVRLSRRAMLAGLGAVGVASAGAGLGTTAYFSDRESFEGNAITAGELDLSVTWQQLYRGGPQSSRAVDYGSAGRPFVNAYPDDDGDGVQSFERDDGRREYVDRTAYDDPEAAAAAGENLAFSCEEIAMFDEPSFGPNDESLIELDDVKPGDCGEITFGIKLCDNPGYVWLHGEPTDEGDGGHPESGGAELADRIRARAWYDDGDNVFQEGETPILGGSLREVLDALRDGVLLASDPDPDFGVPDPDDSAALDGITLTDDDCEVVQGNPSCEDLGLFRAIKVESEALPTALDDPVTYPTPVGDVTITAVAYDDEDGEVLEFDFDLDGFEVTAVIVKAGPSANVCRRPDGDGGFLTADSGEALGGPFNSDGDRRHGVSHVSFCYDTVPPEEPPEEEETGAVCFQPSDTRFIGFEWCLPTTVGNEVQGDSVSFDLSFYTEQCRHNPDPENPFADPEAE